MGRDQKNNQVPFLYDSTTGRICGLRHPDGTEEFIVMSNVKTGTPVNGVKATLTSDMTNANADVTLTAVNYGADGNRISVTYVDPGAINQALKVLVNGENIIVSLATNGAGAITSICNAVVAAINAHEDAKLLVVATAEGTGLGVVNAKAIAYLAGGVTTTPGVPGSTMMKDSSGFLWLKTGEQTWTSFTSTIVDATTTVKGKVELATDTETTTGTSTTVVLTPSNLSARTATESRRGIIELATVAEVLAGVDTERAVTPVGVNAFMTAGDAVTKNPLMYSQGINMTYAASGSSGIQVADNDNVDFGTGDFTLVWKGIIPDYTPYADTELMQKSDGTNGWVLQVDTTGVLQVILNTTTYSSTVAPIIPNGTGHKIIVVITRETASVAGSIVFYVDGVILGTPVVIAAGAPTTVTNAVSMYVMGTSAKRSEGVCYHSSVFNRALSAADVLDLYRNGINFADKWGSQTAVYTSDFSAGVDGWTAFQGAVAGNIDSIGGEGDWLRFTCNNMTGIHLARKTTPSLVVGKKYRLSFKYFIPSANDVMTSISVYSGAGTYLIVPGASLSVIDTATIFTFKFTCQEAGLLSVYGLAGGPFTDAGGDDVFYIKDFAVTEIGATLALEPEGIQPAPGQWLDSSTNKIHAMQPAAGSSLVRSKREFEIRWTNTWAGTHEAQYIGGINQAILPPGCYITSYVYVIAGTTIEDVIIGDGSDTDRWVTITTGLAAGTGEFTLANKISDGTNYKVVIDPDSNFTGSITSIIKGVILT